MYKRVTHDIVEEHYDHPAVIPGNMLGTLKYTSRPTLSPDVVIPRASLSGGLPPLPEAVINERTLVFRMDSRTLWTRYALGMINYSVSAFGNMPSTPAVEKNLSRNAAAVGDYFVPYYGITAGSKIGSLLTVIAKTGVNVVNLINKNQTDIAVYTEIWSRQIDDLARYLHEVNPGQYPTDLIAEMLNSLTRFWVTDFQARFAEDFATDAVALDDILKVAVTGIPNHTNKGYSSIADILSRGIIAQFPLSFVE
jgi:hypothetical protein